jgi:hypothetical protein
MIDVMVDDPESVIVCDVRPQEDDDSSRPVPHPGTRPEEKANVNVVPRGPEPPTHTNTHAPILVALFCCFFFFLCFFIFSCFFSFRGIYSSAHDTREKL